VSIGSLICSSALRPAYAKSGRDLVVPPVMRPPWVAERKENIGKHEHQMCQHQCAEKLASTPSQIDSTCRPNMNEIWGTISGR
jgi:hypothetical protein